MNKAIVYYESKLQTILPGYLLPTRDKNFTADELNLYADVLRSVYNCLTYQPDLTPGEAEKLVMDMYRSEYMGMVTDPRFKGMMSVELIEALKANN